MQFWVLPPELSKTFRGAPKRRQLRGRQCDHLNGRLVGWRIEPQDAVDQVTDNLALPIGAFIRQCPSHAFVCLLQPVLGDHSPELQVVRGDGAGGKDALGKFRQGAVGTVGRSVCSGEGRISAPVSAEAFCGSVEALCLVVEPVHLPQPLLQRRQRWIILSRMDRNARRDASHPQQTDHTPDQIGDRLGLKVFALILAAGLKDAFGIVR
jgi:hypothetical protein